jgi:hypothetical protein
VVFRAGHLDAAVSERKGEKREERERGERFVAMGRD